MSEITVHEDPRSTETSVSVGTAVADGACAVMLTANGESVYLTPKGARLLAKQLGAMASHVEWMRKQRDPWVVKRWIVKFDPASVPPVAEAASAKE